MTAKAIRYPALDTVDSHTIDDTVGHRLEREAVLCTDGGLVYQCYARDRGVVHEPVNLAQGIRVRRPAFHVQNVNFYHSRWKGWIQRVHGVATRDLPNDPGWHRMLEGMRQWLKQWRVGERFVREQVGDDEYHATYPFVELRGEQPIRIITPLHSGQDSASKILDHGGQWVFRLDRLRRRNRLPQQVLFAVDGLGEVFADDTREVAYRQALAMLQDQDITVLPYQDSAAVEAFA